MTVMRRSLLQRFLREPLLHFIIIGGLFFLIYSAVNDTGKGTAGTISITPERIGQIAFGFKGVWNRMPSAEELDSLIEEEIRSEVYYRDALALGLDRNDTIVRRRLRQKMEFLTDTGSYLKEPDADELEAYFTTNKLLYRSEPRLAFEQIFLGESPPEKTVSGTLKILHTESSTDPSSLGEPTLLPAQLKQSQPDAIDSVFGKGFYRQIVGLPSGVWAGPVASVYGTHLIRTLGGREASMPALEEIRDFVLNNWRAAQAEEYREKDYANRRGRYHIEIVRSEDGGEMGSKVSR
jgi:hypothetical protein